MKLRMMDHSSQCGCDGDDVINSNSVVCSHSAAEPEEVSNVRAEHPQRCVVKTESPPGQQDAGEIEGKEPLKVGGKR